MFYTGQELTISANVLHETLNVQSRRMFYTRQELTISANVLHETRTYNLGKCFTRDKNLQSRRMFYTRQELTILANVLHDTRTYNLGECFTCDQERVQPLWNQKHNSHFTLDNDGIIMNSWQVNHSGHKWELTIKWMIDKICSVKCKFREVGADLCNFQK